ncbi:unnamed protein product [Miscanthus lutarioriparius]|uniref:Uncharacterized protein n=1 Tax=Miscanthus lutarioriparius TaxID=422564 RepID=A0A811QP21_9POAL|nr:unnamed protein product [Miscanthus lutarioriparius]
MGCSRCPVPPLPLARRVVVTCTGLFGDGEPELGLSTVEEQPASAGGGGVGPLSGVQQWSSQRNCDSCHLWCSKQQKQHSRRKPSVSSVLDSVTREYPSTKMPEALSCFVQCNIPLGMQGKVHMSKVCISGFQEEGYEDIRGEIEMLQQCRRPNVVRYFGSYQGVKYLWVQSNSLISILLITLRNRETILSLREC